MINSVNLTGRLTNDVELRYTQSGSAVASFSLAVARQFSNAQGQRETDFIQCVVWRKSAEALANYTHKGSLIGITGRLATRTYEKDGKTVYVTEVNVDNFSFLESKKADQSSQTNSYQNVKKTPSAPLKSVNKQPNFGISNTDDITDDPFANDDQPVSISDDDLPF